ncbi:hypothetical protein WDU99_12185 [Microbacterium sp. Mu-80]|uniref:SseB protein N-terminal domain-containing protein n=1 Tax=Microbacterium bandirmense TaxID=3122050 RepID=A0ABU8LEI9_9MICO
MTNAFGDIEMDAVPRIYGASELGVLAITAPGDAHPRVQYVGGELFVGLTNTSTGTAVTQGQVEAWADPFTDAVAAAVASAGAVPAPVDGLILIEDEVLAASVLVDPTRIATAGLSGDPVLIALSRDRVAIVGVEDEAAFGRVLDLADELYDAGGPLVSAHPVAVADGQWARFNPIARFPALEMRVQRVLRLFSVRAYEAQSAALQRPDVHLIDPKIRVLETGVTTTFATWPKGTASLLPVVDNVIVADPSGAISFASMDQFLDAAGDAVVRTGLSPVRYFIPGEAPAQSE